MRSRHRPPPTPSRARQGDYKASRRGTQRGRRAGPEKKSAGHVGLEAGRTGLPIEPMTHLAGPRGRRTFAARVQRADSAAIPPAKPAETLLSQALDQKTEHLILSIGGQKNVPQSYGVRRSQEAPRLRSV